MKCLLTFILSLFSISVLAQTPKIKWQRGVDASDWDMFTCVQPTADGGTIAGGETMSLATYDRNCWLVKMTSNGTVEWSKHYGGSGADYITSVRQTKDKGYIVCATTGSNDGDVTYNAGNNDYWLIKTDSLGNILWQKTYGSSGDELSGDVNITNDGDYILIGSSNSNDSIVVNNHGDYDYWILRLDNKGNVKWSNSFGGSAGEIGVSIQQTFDGQFIAFGSEHGFGSGEVSGGHGDLDFWIVKISASGTLIWEKTYGGLNITGSGLNMLTGGLQTRDSGFIAVGWTDIENQDDVKPGSKGQTDYWIVKLDKAGNLIWQKDYGGPDREISGGITETRDGGYAVVGYTRANGNDVTGFHGSEDFWVIKLNNAGTLQWEQSYGGTDVDDGYAIAQVSDGLVVVGQSNSNDGDVSYNSGINGWVVKLDINTGVSRINSSDTIVLYPNPASDRIMVTNAKGWNHEFYTILNAAGKKLQDGQLDGPIASLSINTLPSGFYILKVGSQYLKFNKY